jgi:hypothetical protein
MRLTIPLTGTVLDGSLTGDPNDPIRPIDIDLGNVSWQMVDVDLENEVMVIEVTPAEEFSEDTGEKDGEGNPIYRTREATEGEKIGFLQNAYRLIMEHSKDELYTMSGNHRLKRPFKRQG